MNGKHVRLVSTKFSAKCHKVLCFVMAIALVTLMIPSGIRAHAESETTQVQDEMQEQQAVPADESVEGGQAEEVIPKSDVKLTLTTLPNNVAGHWVKDHDTMVEVITIPSGATICPQGNSKTSDIDIYYDSSLSEKLYTLNWVSDLFNNEIFETWVFNDTALTSSNSATTICTSDSVFAAGLNGWNTAANDAENTFTVYAESPGGYLEISDDGTDWEPVAGGSPYGPIPIPDVEYYYYTENNTIILYQAEANDLIKGYIRAVAEPGYKFSSWMINATTEPHTIQGADINFAFFDPLGTCYVNLSTLGTGTADFYNLDANKQRIGGSVTTISLPKEYVLRNSDEGNETLVEYGFLDGNKEFNLKGYIECVAHEGCQVNGWNIAGEYQQLLTDTFSLYAYLGPTTYTIVLNSTEGGAFYNIWNVIFGGGDSWNVEIPIGYKYEITKLLGYDCVVFSNAQGDLLTFQYFLAVPDSDNYYCEGITSSIGQTSGTVEEGLSFKATFSPVQKYKVTFETTGAGSICDLDGIAMSEAYFLPGSTYEISWSALFGCYLLTIYYPDSILPSNIYYTRPTDETSQCISFIADDGTFSGTVRADMKFSATFDSVEYVNIGLKTDGDGQGCFRNSLTSQVVHEVSIPKNYTYAVSNEADVFTISFYDTHGTLTRDTVYTESDYYSVCVGVEPNIGGSVADVENFTASFNKVDSCEIKFETTGSGSGKIYKSDGSPAETINILKGSQYKIYWDTTDGRYYLDFYTSSTIIPDHSYYALPDHGNTCTSFLSDSKAIEGTVNNPMSFIATFEKTVYFDVTLATEGGDSSCCWCNYWSGAKIKGAIQIEKNWEYKIVKNNKVYQINFYDSHGIWTGDVYYANSNSNWECSGITPDKMEGVIEDDITFTAHYKNVSMCTITFAVEGEGGVYDVLDPWALDPIYSLNVPKGSRYDLYLYEFIGSPSYYRLDLYTNPYSILPIPTYSFYAQPASGNEFVSFSPLGSGTIDDNKVFNVKFRPIPKTHTVTFVETSYGFVTDVEYHKVKKVEVPDGAHWGTITNQYTGEKDLYIETEDGRQYYYGIGYASKCIDWLTDDEFRTITKDFRVLPYFDEVNLDTVNFNTDGEGAFYDYYDNRVKFTRLPLGCKYSSYKDLNGRYWIDFYQEGSTEPWAKFYVFPHQGSTCVGLTPFGEGKVVDEIDFLAKFEKYPTCTMTLDTYGNGQIFDSTTDMPITENTLEVPVGAIYKYSYTDLSFYDEWGYCYGAYYAVPDEKSNFRGWLPNKSWVVEGDMDFQAQFGVNISGRVVDKNGNEVIGATVRYFPTLKSTDFHILDTSKEYGAYKQIVPSGLEGKLYVSKEGYATTTYDLDAEYTLESHDDLILTLGDEITKLHGTVTHEGGVPVIGAGVYFISNNPSTEPYAYTETDENGMYSFTSLDKGIGGRLVIEDGDGICQVAYKDITDSEMDSDLEVSFELKISAEITIDPKDPATHKEFSWIYTIDDDLIEEGTESSYFDFYDDHTLFSFDKDGVITFGFNNPLGVYEKVVVSPVAAKGYTFDSYVNKETGEALEVGKVYEMMFDSGDVDLFVNYKESQPNVPKEEATAQTGDFDAILFTGLSILALISCAYVAYRRVKISR